MLDVCRHFFSVDEVKRIIEQALLLKMNQFHWYLSEDQGWRSESTRFPQLNEISSWRKLSPDDPVVLAAFPQYTCNGLSLNVKNTLGIHDRIYCAGKAQTYGFLFELLDELMEIFPSHYIHLPRSVFCILCRGRRRRFPAGRHFV